MIDFEDILYLQSGDATQRHAYHVLTTHAILEQLSDFTPILTGTIPLQIYIEGSDLDIVCYWRNKAAFIAKLRSCFNTYDRFNLSEFKIGSFETIIANFFVEGFEIEVFGQSRPGKEQPAYQHMLKEYLILQLHGDEFKKNIIALKREGYKTEPAFAKLLGLKGDPYEALLKLEIEGC